MAYNTQKHPIVNATNLLAYSLSVLGILCCIALAIWRGIADFQWLPTAFLVLGAVAFGIASSFIEEKLPERRVEMKP